MRLQAWLRTSASRVGCPSMGQKRHATSALGLSVKLNKKFCDRCILQPYRARDAEQQQARPQLADALSHLGISFE